MNSRSRDFKSRAYSDSATRPYKFSRHQAGCLEKFLIIWLRIKIFIKQDAMKDLNFLTKNFTDFCFTHYYIAVCILKAPQGTRTLNLSITSAVRHQLRQKSKIIMIELYRISPSMFTYWLLLTSYTSYSYHSITYYVQFYFFLISFMGKDILRYEEPPILYSLSIRAILR